MGNFNMPIQKVGSKSEHYGLMEMHLSKWQHRQNSQMNHWWIRRYNKNTNRRKIRCLLLDEMYCCFCCSCYFYCSVAVFSCITIYFMFLFCKFFILFLPPIRIWCCFIELTCFGELNISSSEIVCDEKLQRTTPIASLPQSHLKGITNRKTARGGQSQHFLNRSRNRGRIGEASFRWE